MNSLTVNLHLMMASFYRPTADRHKIMIEGGAFPSDQYAVKSQIRFHGFDPASSLIELSPRGGESCMRQEDILSQIERVGDTVGRNAVGVARQCIRIDAVHVLEDPLVVVEAGDSDIAAHGLTSEAVRRNGGIL